jgi:RNA polymerase sigma factor (sigma-70 family)
MEADDMELLRDYIGKHSDQAFRTLVERHIDMVYAVALRQTQNAQFAEDVTQAVFIVLAEKAATIPQNTILAGWLFRATRFAAANVRRAEARREHWEQKAAQMEPTSPSQAEVEQVTQLLNEALEQLPALDRAAILLRFFESKSMEEVGRTLGTSESAAKMRLSRAVEKLRDIFRKRGVVVPAAAMFAVLSAHAAHAAPAGLASSIATSALLNQSSASTLMLAKGTLKVMAQAKAKKLVIAAFVLLFGGAAAVLVQQTLSKMGGSKETPARDTKVSAISEAKAAVPATHTGAVKVLVFRNRPSWNRQPDFEDRLVEMGLDFEVKPAELMGSTELAPYRFIIIPGSQSTSEFYAKYAEHAARFDQYVTNGGTLVLELNGAERNGLPMPRGVNMVMSPAKDNAVTLPNHPILVPLGGRPIHATYASHGYLSDLPPDAIVLATELVDGEPLADKPTFVEYVSGQGRVIAACQCFHDRDNSGRGVLMQTVLGYAAEKKWYAPKN